MPDYIPKLQGDGEKGIS